MSGKKKKGPSRGSGALSVGLAIFGMIWTYTIYMQRAPVGQLAFGVIFVFLCLAHAAYNFRAVNRQEAMERGEVPGRLRDAAETETKTGAAGKKQRKHPVYRVKKKPSFIVKRRRRAG